MICGGFVTILVMYGGELLKKTGLKKVVPFRHDAEIYYNIGLKYAGRKKFAMSARFFERAAEKEPFDADYQFNLACIYAELRQTEKSNKIMLDILKYIDPTLSECYFGIGCNYFDMGNFKKSREYFEAYTRFDPDGQFAEETSDIIYYLQIYEDIGHDGKRGKLAGKLAAEGRRMLDEGMYAKACTKLEKAVEIDTGAISFRNDFSMACFFTGQINKAISLAKSVLKLQTDDITANCNLTLFYEYDQEFELYERQLKLISKLRAKNQDEFMKLIETYIKLKQSSHIKDFLKKFLKNSKRFINKKEIRSVLNGIVTDDTKDKEMREIIRESLTAKDTRK